jgi:hypothetical protein
VLPQSDSVPLLWQQAAARPQPQDRHMPITFAPTAFMMRLFAPYDVSVAPRSRVTRRFPASVREGTTRVLMPSTGRLTLHCRGGQAWITQDGVPKDVLLNANESYTADSSSRMTLHALKGDCEFEIQMED